MIVCEGCVYEYEPDEKIGIGPEKWTLQSWRLAHL